MSEVNLCPSCHREAFWEQSSCPHCGYSHSGKAQKETKTNFPDGGNKEATKKNSSPTEASRMNPMKWDGNHQLALLIAVLVGASLGVVLGYILYASGSGADGATRFGNWLRYPIRLAGLWWGMFGAVIGAAVIYLKILTSNQPTTKN